MDPVVLETLREARAALDALIANPSTIEAIGEAGRLLAKVFRDGGRVFSCGNGGSMCDAMHLAEELSGRYRLDRAALPATAISDPSHLSCVANDYGYEQVFSRYVEAHAHAGDCLVAISTSGTSRNVVMAAEKAKVRGVKIIALTGHQETPLGALADIEIYTPAGRFADRVQELHIKVVHILIELIERELFPENYRT
ncbi:MAG TPA: SIS domain-containing protein [Stellaceae bacterium]|jgi:D-sedoheptulose 7-phosphate isomerase|nr:SIS domain-containing protein [Stellaceae bacterium]